MADMVVDMVVDMVADMVAAGDKLIEYERDILLCNKIIREY